MNRRVLGRTGLQVSEIGFGGWAIGGNAYGNSYGPTDDAESKRAVRRAYELGCNFFDTADVYGHGHSEDVIGEALHDVRDKVIIATKVGGNFYNRDVHPLMRERISQAVGRSLDEIESGAALPVTHDTNFTASYIGLPYKVRVREILDVFRTLYGASRKRVDEVVEMLRLGEFADRCTSQLSSGQRTRPSLPRQASLPAL